MTDFETRLSTLLKDATPDPPAGLTINPDGLHRARPQARTLIAPAGAVAAVLLIVSMIVMFHPHRSARSDAGHTGLKCADQPTHYPTAIGADTIPQPTPVIVGDRLVCPFSISNGQIRLTPIAASYRPTITADQALATLTGDGNRPTQFNGPPLFLAYLSADLPLSTLRPVWVSLLYEPDPIIPAMPTNPRTFRSAPLTTHLADAIDTIDAQTGKYASGTNLAAPDQPNQH